jgi:two-component system, response regulator PdtaR
MRVCRRARAGCDEAGTLRRKGGEFMYAVDAGLAPARPTMLLVEDEVLIRLLIAEELRETGIHVLEASNAGEALVVLQSSLPVHLLFTDVHMPGPMDGLALTRLVRARYPHIKLMVTSSQQPQGYAREAADVFIRKPYDLQAAVRQAEKLLAESGHVCCRE